MAFAVFGADRSSAGRFSGGGYAHPFRGLAEALIGVWGRWDSVWYMKIAVHGYAQAPDRPAFFPLYPLISRGVADVAGLFSPGPKLIFVSAIVVSFACLGVALYVLHRLCELELGADAAALTLALVAFFPMAVFYGAVYTESLFLLASVAAVWFARCDRWALAGLCAAAAAATRSAGVLLVLPLALLYLLGPRGRGERAQPYLGLPWRAGPRRITYPLRADALWMLLVPAGLAAYMLYLTITDGDPLRFASAQSFWGHRFGHIGPIPAGPLGGAWQATVAAVRGGRDLIRGSQGVSIWTPDGGGSLGDAGVNLEAFAFLVFGVTCAVGALRRLPLAYGAYAVAVIALTLSSPVSYGGFDVPLISLPRYLAVVFPLFMWLGLVVRERGWQRPALIVSALLAGLYAAQFTTWQWVS